MATTSLLPENFSISEFLMKGWEFLKEHFMTLLVFGVVFLLASAVPTLLVDGLFGRMGFLHFVLRVATWVWGAYLSLGGMRYMLAMLRGKSPELSVAFNNTADFQKYFIMYLRVAFVVVGGMFLLVVPGIYWATKYAFVLFLVADGKADGAEAFKMSARMTEGNKLTIFLYFLVTGVLTTIGMMLLLIPGLIIGASAGIGFYMMYEYLLKSTK